MSKQTQPGVPSRGLPGPSLVSEGAPGSGLRSVPQDLPGVPSRCRTPSSLIPGISRFAPGTTKRAFVTLAWCHESVTIAASHRASRRPEKKIPAGPPNDHQFYQFHQFHRWGAFSVILADFLATSGLYVLFEDRETLRRGDFVCMQARFGDLMDDQ